MQQRLVAFVTDLTFVPDRGPKHEAVADVLMALHDAIVYHTEREFAQHCRDFDARAVLSRLDEKSRMRRNTGPLVQPSGGE
jgi:hypothetical protein